MTQSLMQSQHIVTPNPRQWMRDVAAVLFLSIGLIVGMAVSAGVTVGPAAQKVPASPAARVEAQHIGGHGCGDMTLRASARRGDDGLTPNVVR